MGTWKYETWRLNPREKMVHKIIRKFIEAIFVAILIWIAFSFLDVVAHNTSDYGYHPANFFNIFWGGAK